MSDKLLFAEIKSVSNEVCWTEIMQSSQLGNKLYLGGGWFMKKSNIFELHGIVSASLLDDTTKVCDPTKYAIFTNVNHFADWIREKAQEKWKYIEVKCDFDNEWVLRKLI